jgi:hypothetical protein
MRVGAVLHPAMVLAFADRAGFIQHVDRPATQGTIAGRLSRVISIGNLLGRILEARTRAAAIGANGMVSAISSNFVPISERYPSGSSASVAMI